MKFYCKNCDSDFNIGEKVDVALWQACPICKEGKLENMIIPNYETPAQYKKRTGKKYPEEGAVFGKPDNKWIATTWSYAKLICNAKDIVIADPPVPPNDNWRPA